MTVQVAPSIRSLDANAVEARLDALAEILVDAVVHGSSVNFLAGLSLEEARSFWRKQIPGLTDGDRTLFVVETRGRILGTAILFYMGQPNQPHRAEVGKMLVLSSAQRQGLGRQLLAAVEAAARARGRTLLMLDTESGSAGEHLYRATGWTEFGRVPGHALKPDGRPAETTFFYKTLA